MNKEKYTNNELEQFLLLIFSDLKQLHMQASHGNITISHLLSYNRLKLWQPKTAKNKNSSGDEVPERIT